MEPDLVATHLAPYGYTAASTQDWADSSSSSSPSWPQLRLTLGGHTEISGHTQYTVECGLSAERPALQLDWQCQTRLAQLREELHDTVKNELGKDYSEVFSTAPFAKRGGWHGTSERLRKWLETLASCVNEGKAPPVLVSQVLLYFGAPAQSDHQASAEAVDEAPEAASEASAPSIADVEARTEDARDRSPLTRASSGSLQRTASGGYAPDREATATSQESEDQADGKAESRLEEAPAKAAAPALAEVTPSKSSSSTATPEGETAVEPAEPKAVEDDVTSFLGAYGYAASNSSQWSEVPASCLGKPVLRLALESHSEEKGHTIYNVQCSLSAGKPMLSLEWIARRRLGQLREDLHDVVKAGLGKDYAELFSQAPFARRGGLAGTTGRLQTWLDTLASCINEHSMTPGLVANILRLLETPALPKSVASPQKARAKVIPQVWGDPLPKTHAPPTPTPPPRAPSPVPQAEGHADAACSPIDGPASEKAFEDAAGTPRQAELGAAASDDETSSHFSNAKRQRGYRKLREWFMSLKRSLEKKMQDVQPSR